MCSILLRQPSDLVDLFFNLQTLQVVKVWFMALESAVDIVLPRVHRLPHLLRFAFRLKCIKLYIGNGNANVLIWQLHFKLHRMLWIFQYSEFGPSFSILALETDLGLPLEDDHSATFIPSGQEISSLVKFHRRDDISWEEQFNKNRLATTVTKRIEKMKQRNYLEWWNAESNARWCLKELVQSYQPLLWHHKFPWCAITGFRTFSNIVSQKSVVDFGTLSVLAHLKLREGDPPVRPSWGKGSSLCSRSPPRLRPCCYGLAEWPGTRHPGKTAGRKKTRRGGDGDAGNTKMVEDVKQGGRG